MPAASSSISRRSVGLAAMTALILPWLTSAGRMGAGRGVGEQQGDVLGADVAAVDPIGGAGAALDPAGDLDVADRRHADVARHVLGLALDQQRDFGEIARRAGRGAGEDDVVHAGAAHRLGRGFAHHPADRLEHVGFAAAIGADDAGQARLDAQLGRLDEAFEAGKLQPLYLHGAPPGRSSYPAVSRRIGSSVAQVWAPILAPLRKKVGVPLTPSAAAASIILPSRSSAAWSARQRLRLGGRDAVLRGDRRDARELRQPAQPLIFRKRARFDASAASVSVADPADPLALGGVELVGRPGRNGRGPPQRASMVAATSRPFRMKLRYS